jgi:outer membrane assembly lipoprotein YfiO
MMVGRTYSARKLRPDRDLSNIHEALNAYQQLINLYPDSEHAEEAAGQVGDLRELLAEHEWIVARFYERNKRWLGALWRLQYIQENYPDFSRMSEVEAMVAALEDEMAEQERKFREMLEQRAASIEKSGADDGAEETADEGAEETTDGNAEGATDEDAGGAQTGQD